MRNSQFNVLIANLFLIAGFLANNPVSMACLMFLACLWSIWAIYTLIKEKKEYER